MASDIDLNVQLKNKRICRFCMTLKEPLSNIYSNENRLNSRAPLPLQIMACVSIEVFTNDGMPSTICDACRLLMDHSYRFKQMCKKADTALKQFPLTGQWPEKLEFPKYPEELIRMQQIPVPLPIIIKKEIHSQPTNSNTIPIKRQKLDNSTKQVLITQQEIPAYSSQIQKELPSPKEKILQKGRIVQKSAGTISQDRPKILNKNTVKILNINAPGNTPEPVLSRPVIRTDESGNVEIITEILENYDNTDPIKYATPVETNVFPCDHCERSFPLRQLLEIHMTNHVRERSFMCPICDKGFFSKYDLGKHSLIHTGEKPYACVVCKKAFSRSTLLSRHEKIHTDQPKFLCVFCERPFLSKEELDKHTERHKKRRPYPCKICGKSFAFKQGLERHENIHSKEQPFQCEHCDKSFSTPSKLARHLTAHAGRRPYPCRLCPKSYLLSHHLTRHVRSHKDGSGSYKCYDCINVFATRDELIYHSAVHATQNLTCPLCKEKFHGLDEVTAHIKSHTNGEQYACEFCDLIFSTEEKLDAHSATEHADEQAEYLYDNKTRIVKKEITDEEMQLDEAEMSVEEYITEEPSMQQRESKILNNMANTAVKVEKIDEIILHSQDNLDCTDSINYMNDDDDENEYLDENEETEIIYENEVNDFHLDNNEFVVNHTKTNKTYTENPPKILNSTNLSKSQIQSQPDKQFLNKNKTNDVKMSVLPVLTKINLKNPKQSIAKDLNILKQEKLLPEIPSKSATAAKIISQTIIKPASSDAIAFQKSNIIIAKKTIPNKVMQMKIGDEMVKVQKVKMTKSQVAAMAKEGKIEVKGGQVFLKQKSKNSDRSQSVTTD